MVWPTLGSRTAKEQNRTLLQTDNHASTPPLCFIQAGCPSCHPTNSVKALKAAFYTYGSKHMKERQLAESRHIPTNFCLTSPTTSPTDCNLSFIFDKRLTFSGTISSLPKLYRYIVIGRRHYVLGLSVRLFVRTFVRLCLHGRRHSREACETQGCRQLLT